MKRLGLLLILSLFAVQLVQASTISKVAFSRGAFIYVKDMKSGLEKRVAKGTYPSISADGASLVYSHDGVAPNKDMTREIRVVDVNTGKVTEFESLKKYLCYGAVWSPDSTKLALSLFKDSRWHAVVIDVQSRNWKIVSERVNTSMGVSSITWASDSNSILAQDLDNIYRLGLDGQLMGKFVVSEVVDDTSFVSSGTTYVLSSDGQTLFFDTEQPPGERRPPMVWRYDLATKTRKQLSPKTLSAGHPVLLPSGDEIVFTGVSLQRKGSQPGVYRMKTDGTGVQLLVANADFGSVAVE